MTDKELRELDAFIAEHVFDWVWLSGIRNSDVFWPKEDGAPQLMPVDISVKAVEAGPVHLPSIPHYSTDIAAAWEVVEKMVNEKKWLFDMHSTISLLKKKKFKAVFKGEYNGELIAFYSVEDPALAICLAVKKAVEGR